MINKNLNKINGLINFDAINYISETVIRYPFACLLGAIFILAGLRLLNILGIYISSFFAKISLYTIGCQDLLNKSDCEFKEPANLNMYFATALSCLSLVVKAITVILIVLGFLGNRSLGLIEYSKNFNHMENDNPTNFFILALITSTINLYFRAALTFDWSRFLAYRRMRSISHVIQIGLMLDVYGWYQLFLGLGTIRHNAVSQLTYWASNLIIILVLSFLNAKLLSRDSNRKSYYRRMLMILVLVPIIIAIPFVDFEIVSWFHIPIILCFGLIIFIELLILRYFRYIHIYNCK